MLTRRPTVLSCVLVWALYAGLLGLVLRAQSPQSPTPEDLTNQIDQKLDDARRLNDQLRTMLQPCTYAVAPTTVPPVPAAGDTLTFQVTTTGASCGWSVVAADPWLAPSSASGTDSGPVTILVSANGTAAARSTTVTIAGQPITVPQDGQPPPTSPIVTDAAGLTAAIAAREPIIRIQGTITGNFTIPRGAGPMTLIGRDDLTGRATPADVASTTITAGDPLFPVLTIWADDVTIRGLTLTGTLKDRTFVQVGDNRVTDAAQLPHRVTFDQVAILGTNGYGHRGIQFEVTDGVVTRSHIAGFREEGRESQAIYVSNGPGPYRIEDNYLEASGENIMFGGDDPRIPNLVPADITIRNNLIMKPLAWKATPSTTVKNLVEFKNARRVLLEGNTLDGCWRSAQDGSSILLTPRNQYGKAPWVQVADIIIRGNILRNATDAYAVNILGTDNNNPSQQTTNVTIEGNLFEDASNGIRVGAGVAGTLTVQRNTLPAIRGNFLAFTGATTVLTPLAATRNVTKSGAYGVTGDNVSPGVPALTKYTTALVFTNNVIEKTAARVIPWPAGNTLLAPGGLAPLLDPAYHYTPDPSLGW